MATFHVQTGVLVERWYQVEADSPEEAIDLVRTGDRPTYFQQNDLDIEEVGRAHEVEIAVS